jgi:heme/copper-type cytochrome/quinol oxidase subunit 3
MAELGIILFILSVLLFFGGIIFLIILSVMNKPLKPAGVVLLASALLFLVSFTLCSTSNFNL